jgi:hypothetical protein
MTLVSGLTTTYLSSTVLPYGLRQQFAGALYSAADYYARGGTGAPPINRRITRIMYQAERDSTPNQPSLTADYLALTGP